jgi:hypothetical protein
LSEILRQAGIIVYLRFVKCQDLCYFNIFVLDADVQASVGVLRLCHCFVLVHASYVYP